MRKTDDSTPFLTLSIPAVSQSWQFRAREGLGVTCDHWCGQGRGGKAWSLSSQQTNRVQCHESKFTIYTDIRKGWSSFYTKEELIFWYFRHVFNILMVSRSSPREYLDPDDTGISHLGICQLAEFRVTILHTDKYTDLARNSTQRWFAWARWYPKKIS